MASPLRRDSSSLHMPPRAPAQRTQQESSYDATALAEELRGVAELHATLRPAGSFDQLIAVAEGRIFVEGRAERERLATPAADRADVAAFALVSATEAVGGR